MKKIDFNNVKTKRIISWIIFALIIVNIAAFILILDKLYFWADLTKGKKYSISKASVELVNSLEDKMVIEYYYSSSCKEIKRDAQIVQYIEELLHEYERKSSGNLEVIINELEYGKDDQIIDKLDALGIKSEPRGKVDKKGTSAQQLLMFSGIVIKYKGLQDKVMQRVFNDKGFEFNLDLIIKEMSEGEDKTVLGIMNGTGSGGFYQQGGYYYFKSEILSKEIKDIKEINSGSNIPDEVNFLIVVGGAGLTDFDIFNIDQFLMNGGKAIFYTDGVQIQSQPYMPQQKTAIPTPDNKLNKLIEHYGIKINTDIIGDMETHIPYPKSNYELVPFPIFPIIDQKSFNKEHDSVSDLMLLCLNMPSSIKILPDAKNKAKILFTSGMNGVQQNSSYNLDPETLQYMLQGQPTGKFDLAAVFSGQSESFFKGKSIPSNLTNPGEEFSGAIVDSGKADFIIVADDDFIQDEFISLSYSLSNTVSFQELYTFIHNSIESLSIGHSLSEIRNKGKFSQPLNEASGRSFTIRKNVIKTFTTFIVPLLLILFGIALFVIRQIIRKYSESRYKDGKADNKVAIQKKKKNVYTVFSIVSASILLISIAGTLILTFILT